MPKGLYVHIPFCKQRCHYCNFVTTANAAPRLRERFFQSLERQIRHVHEAHGKLFFETLYVGGGTPSILSRNEAGTVMGLLQENFRFDQNAEITCEWNPGDGDEDKIKTFQAFGVNRISLGVQSFQERLLNRLGRRHSVQDTLDAIARIREAGIHNISFDLMLRIPGQEEKDFRASLDQSVKLGASQVSLYDLEIHRGTVFGEAQQKGRLVLPPEEAHAKMYQAAVDILGKAGYEHYEISNFAKPGFASRHNLLYWHNEEYLGLGPGAFSYLNGIRYQFAASLERYLDKCESQDWRNDQEDVLSEEERETETFVMLLRLKEGADPEKFPLIYPKLKDRIQLLLQEGVMEYNGEKTRLTDRGKFLSEDVFGFLLRDEEMRFSPHDKAEKSRFL